MIGFKKLLPASIVFIWIFFLLFEIGTLVFLNPKPSVRRAWETAMVPDIASLPNRDSIMWAPFRPRFIYDNMVKGGDSTGWLNFQPLQEEMFKQHFEVDEFGFRNSVGTYKQGVTMVIFGTSNVGGSQLSQETLVSELLAKKYNIPSYNYALRPMQFFWEDERFQKTPPKYVVILSTGDGIISGDEVTALQETNKSHQVREYQSYDQWWKENLGVDYIKAYLNYDGITPWLKYLSTTRYIANKIRRDTLNLLFTKNQLASIYANERIIYDPKLDMLFFDSMDPLLNEQKEASIKQTISQLKQTQKVLKTRGITLIVIGVPTKVSLYSETYRDLPREKFALVKMEEEMEKNEIEHLELYDLMSNLFRRGGMLLHFKQDTHWNSKTNEIITELLAKRIKELDIKSQNSN